MDKETSEKQDEQKTGKPEPKPSKPKPPGPKPSGPKAPGGKPPGGGKSGPKKIKPKDDEPDLSKEIAGVTRTKKAWICTFGLAILSFLLIMGLSATRLIKEFELKTIDFRFRLRPQIAVKNDIVMIDIDDESLRKYGRWPWPRTRIAQIVKGLNRHQAARVLIDIEFVDPSQITVAAGQKQDTIRQEIDSARQFTTDIVSEGLALIQQGYGIEDIAPSLIQENGEIDLRFKHLGNFFEGVMVDPDRLLAESLRQFGHVFLISHLRKSGGSQGKLDDFDRRLYESLRMNLDKLAEEIAAELSYDVGELESRLPRVRAKVLSDIATEHIRAAAETAEVEELVEVTLGSLPTGEPFRFRSVVEQIVPWEYSRHRILQKFGVSAAQFGPVGTSHETGGLVPLVPLLVNATRGAGFSNADPDLDGTFRRLPLFLSDGDRVLFHGSFLLSLDYLGVSFRDVRLTESNSLLLSSPDGKHIEVPLDRDGFLPINWAGGWKTFKHVSACNLLDEQEMEKWQWDLLLMTDARYLGSQLEELAAQPFTPVVLEQAAEIVLPQMQNMADRLRQQLETNPRLQDDAAKKKRMLDRIDQIEGITSGYNLIEAEKEVIRNNLATAIKDGSCVIELTASGTSDIGVIPFAETYPMGETYANALNSFCNGAFLRELPPKWTHLEALFLVFVLGALLPFLGLWSGMGVALALVAGHCLAGYLLFSQGNIITGMVSPLLTALLAFIVISAYHRILTFKAFLLYRQEKQTLDRDIELAKRIQKRLQPATLPKMEGLDIAGRSIPARGLAGDFYTFFELDKNRLGAAIADITGKGVAAALLANMIRSAMKTVIATTGDSPQVMEQVNALVAREQIIKESSFATCMYLTLDMDTLKLTFANAGHNPIIVARKGEKECLEMFTRGVPVGVMKRMRYKQVEETLKPGDVLFLFTDGINEAMTSKQDMYGMDRMKEVIFNSRHLTSEEIMSAVYDDVNKFVGDYKQYDDMTAIILKISEDHRTQKAEEEPEPQEQTAPEPAQPEAPGSTTGKA